MSAGELTRVRFDVTATATVEGFLSPVWLEKVTRELRMLVEAELNRWVADVDVEVEWRSLDG